MPQKRETKMRTGSASITTCLLVLSSSSHTSRSLTWAWSHSPLPHQKIISGIRSSVTFWERDSIADSYHRRYQRCTVLNSASSSSPSPVSSATSEEEVTVPSTPSPKEGRKALVRQQGGPLSFSTKYGALNPYAIFYGLTAIFLGIAWYLEMMACKLMYFLSRRKFDPMRRIPIFFSQVWGETLMFLTRAAPKIENKHILKEFYKTGKSAMFVANHNSWQDIPYLGKTIGWRNYKIIAKKELEKVPILSSAIIQGGHVIVDRTNRRSQLMTLKTGMKWLQDGVHLCTFPEGTRSRTGRLMPFKNGAFKMAYKVGAPVVPLSIVGAGEVQPSNWMFPKCLSRGVAKVVVHEPIYPQGKTEDELAREVRKAVISGLPENQRPLDEEEED